MIKWNGQRFVDRFPTLAVRITARASRSDVDTTIAAGRLVPSLPIIAADQVAEWVGNIAALDDASGKVMNHLANDDIHADYWPRYNASFERMWIEYKVPRTLNPAATGNSYVGAIIERHRVDAPETLTHPAMGSVCRAYAQTLADRDVKFILCLHVFECGWNNEVAFIGAMLLFVDGQGRHRGSAYQYEADELETDVITARAITIVHAMALMSCSNSELVDVEPPERSAKQRRGGPVLHSYKVLSVFDVRRRTASRGVPSDTSADRPWHKVRGHYAKYGPDYGRGLLFGRLAGQFWISDHDRGDIANGSIAKDYSLAKERAPITAAESAA